MTVLRLRGHLFWKYLAVFFMLVGVVLVVSSLVELYFSYEETKHSIVGLEREKAVAAAYRIEQFVLSVEREVRGTLYPAPDHSVPQPSGGHAQESRQSVAATVAQQREYDFLRLLRDVPAISDVRHLDASGKERLLVSRAELNAVHSDADFAAAPAFRVAQVKKKYFSPVSFRDDSAPYMSIAVALNEPSPEVTLASLDLRAIWDVISRIRVGSAGYAYVVDGEDRLIAHPDISMVLQKRDLSQSPQVEHARTQAVNVKTEGTFFTIATGFQGREVLSVHAPIAQLGWLVFIEQPLKEVLVPLRTQMIRSAIVLLLGLTMSVLTSIFFARRMVAPIRRLQAGAARIGKGELDHRIDVRTGDELEALAAEFNNATAQLQDSQRNLEQKVEARTEALTRSLEEMRALGEVGRAVSSTLDLDKVLNTIIAHAVELSGADAGGTIYEFDETSGIFEPRANHGVSERYAALLRDLRIRLGETAVGLCAAERRPYQTPDLETAENNRVRETLLREGIRAVLAVPLVREEHVIGALVVRRKIAGEFPQSVVTLLQNFADQSVLAIQNARLFKEIQAKGEELQAANQHKSAFLANMSHELRTPLNAIIGIGELLEEDARDLQRDEELEPLARILRAARHLLSLINDILDLSKIEAGRLDLHVETVAIRPLLDDIKSTIQPLAVKNGNTVVVECAPEADSIHVDQLRLRQALLNLVSNANKFSEEGEIRITAGIEFAAGHKWTTFTVSDTGIGMTQEQVARLFQDFVQMHDKSERKYGGTGLGLAITRRLCRMMGGDVVVQSELHRGSTFTIRLPAEAEAHAESSMVSQRQLSASSLPLGQRPLVLIVEDDSAGRHLLTTMLAREGFAVAAASNGEEALRMAQELKPCAITLDILMPEMDGWQVLSHLKQNPSLADIPVVLVSVLDEPERGYLLGATDYMVKPVDRRKLVDRLRQICHSTIHHVLVVDDDAGTRKSLRKALEQEGTSVTEAENGLTALRLLAANIPDAIVLDLLMPEMDGFDFLDELRQRPEFIDIPIVVLTARDLTADDRQRLHGTVERILHKSERSNTLRATARLLRSLVVEKPVQTALER